MRTILCCAMVLSCGLASTAQAAIIYGVQSGTGQIVAVDPNTGLVGYGYAAPGGLSASNTTVGLTAAQGDSSLLFINSGVSANTMYRINPTTGAVLSTIPVQSWGTSGLSYSNIAGVERVYRAHGTTTGGDMHLQTPLGLSESFFFTGGSTAGGVGGDGNGRQFGLYTGGLIREFNEISGAFIGAGFASPLNSVGLAYDGTNLFVSTSTGQLLTLNPNTGAVLTTVNVQGGALFEIGVTQGSLAAAVPEPATLAVFGGMALAGALGYRRRKATA